VPHIESEAIFLESARAAAELFVLLDDAHVGTRVGELTGRREPTDAAPDHDDRLTGQRFHIRT